MVVVPSRLLADQDATCQQVALENRVFLGLARINNTDLSVCSHKREISNLCRNVLCPHAETCPWLCLWLFCLSRLGTYTTDRRTDSGTSGHISIYGWYAAIATVSFTCNKTRERHADRQEQTALVTIAVRHSGPETLSNKHIAFYISQ